MVEEHPLTAFRKRQNPPMTRAALARMMGVSRPTVLRWETGERKVGRDLLPLVSERTGIAPSELRPDLAGLLRRPERTV